MTNLVSCISSSTNKMAQEAIFRAKPVINRSLAYFMLDFGRANYTPGSNNRAKSSFQSDVKCRSTNKRPVFPLATILRLLLKWRSFPSLSALDCGYRVDREQFSGLPRLSGYSVHAAVVSEHQGRGVGCSLVGKLGRFQRWNYARGARKLRTFQRIVVAHHHWPQRGEAG
jgi:hypothetical protein